MTIKVSTHKIHPHSVKALKRGHPFITADRFTSSFDRNSLLIHAKDDLGQFIATILHDPKHPEIKGRFFSSEAVEAKDFIPTLSHRIAEAVTKREPPFNKWNRDNLYLIFGEADYLPGLFVQKLGKTILIQFYCESMSSFHGDCLKTLKELLPTIDLFIVQIRNKGQMANYLFYDTNLHEIKIEKKSEIISEYGVNFRLDFGNYYDHGIYTDMSAIRESLFPLIAKSKSFLNLYSYTGAFSLHALRLNVKSVTSIDLSEKYLRWLDENIQLNNFDRNSQHISICGDVQKECRSLKKGHYDLIIADPPSSSSDGSQRSNALKDYEKTLPLYIELLESRGHLIIFLNTHTISAIKFEEKIKTVLPAEMKIVKKLKLTGDCPTLNNFPEGSYLKGLVLRKN